MNTLGDAVLSSVATPATRATGVRTSWATLGTMSLVALTAMSLVLGTRQVSFGDVVTALGGGSGGIGEAAVAARVPRTVLALLVGAALAMSGATMQAITRNPLADPGILGVSGGASLAVVVGVAYFGVSDPYGYLALALFGAMVAAALVYVIGSMGRREATPLTLALAGAATAAAFSSLVTAILLPRVEVMTSFRFWQIGGVGGATWDRIVVVIPFLAAGALICMIHARTLDSLAFGDDLATGLGADVGRARLLSGFGAVLLCGVATSVAGPIAFVGLVVPHVCRFLVGTDHRWLLPVSALGGACLLVAADVVGRIVARPEEVEVGIITAVIGAPVLVGVARRHRVRGL